jgi:hypothetical protein
VGCADAIRDPKTVITSARTHANIHLGPYRSGHS